MEDDIQILDASFDIVARQDATDAAVRFVDHDRPSVARMPTACVGCCVALPKNALRPTRPRRLDPAAG